MHFSIAFHYRSLNREAVIAPLVHQEHSLAGAVEQHDFRRPTRKSGKVGRTFNIEELSPSIYETKKASNAILFALTVLT